MYDIAVIGAGIVGGMIARRLSRLDLKLCILEKENDVGMGASRANSAIVHAGFDAKEGSLKAKLNVRGSEMMEDIARELDIKYIRNESLVVAFAHERDSIRDLYERGLRNGVKGMSILEKEELHALEPRLNPELDCALRASTGAIICPFELCLASVGNAMDNGADLMCNFEVSNIQKTADGYTVTASDGRQIQARYLINSAGLYSDKIADMTGDGGFTVHARRGEYMILDKSCSRNITSRSIFHTPTKMGKGILITPSTHGNILLGPTAMDIGDKEDRSTTPEGFADIMSKTGDNVMDIPFNQVITSFCGLRAVGDTGDFIIRERDGVVTLGGIESPGLSASPAIAEYVEELLRAAGMDAEQKADYQPHRTSLRAFGEMSLEEKNAVIAKDPRYGRIVCRCEQITEGEIVESIHKNPGARDLDGVKRRTRSGMGRCQGGFCSTIVLEILARELKLDLTEVTKFGGGSVINYRKTKGGV